MKRLILILFIVGTWNLVVAQDKGELPKLIKKASLAFVEGRYEEALTYLRKAYAILPDPNILWNMGRCYEEMGEYKDALRVFFMYQSLAKNKESRHQAEEKIAKIKKQWADELEISGAKLEAEGKLLDALAMYKDAFDLVHRPADLWKIAMIHKKRKEWADAIDALQQYIGMHPGKTEEAAARQELAVIKVAFQQEKLLKAQQLIKSGEFSGALELLRSAYELRRDPAVLWEVGRLYERWGKREEAVRIYESLLRMDLGKDLRRAVEERLEALRRPGSVQGIHRVVRKRKGSGLRTAGYITGALGGAVLIAGAVFVGLAYKDYGTLQTAQEDKEGRIVGLSQQEAEDISSRADFRQTLGWGLVGAGAGILVVSGVLYWLGVREGIHAGIGPTGRLTILGEF